VSPHTHGPSRRNVGMVLTRPRYGERLLTKRGSPTAETGGAQGPRSQTVTLELDEFGAEEFADFARRQGASTSRVAAMAARYFLADAGDEQSAWRVPGFAHKVASELGHGGVRVELDGATWDALLLEARRQGVEIGVLAAHAVLYFMTDVHSGRVAARLAQAIAERRDG
jgi:hypothetical protein